MASRNYTIKLDTNIISVPSTFTVNPLWRSNSDMLREDAEENVNLAVPKVRHRSDSVMVVTSLFGSNDGLIESCNDLEKVFTESPIKMIARDYSVLRNPARKRRLTVGVNSATKADCPTQGTYMYTINQSPF